VELRASGDRAVLTRQDGPEEHEVDLSTLALPDDLSSALHEWARVAAAVHRSGPETNRDAANSVVSHRGRQLAGRIAAATGTAVNYRDPITGELSMIRSTVDEADERGPSEDGTGAPTASGLAEHAAGRDSAPPSPAASHRWRGATAEPTPWATGITVSLFMAVVTFEAVLTLTVAVDDTSHWLALLANVLVTAGLAPSVWLARRVPIWRWVALGTACGLAVGWLCLPFVVFS
jgi:hypothetical protein